MTSTLTAPPASIDAGTTVSYTRTFADYPASAGWALTFYLAGQSKAFVAGVASGDSFVVTLPAATTAGLAAGRYQWIEQVVKAGEKYNAARGELEVLPDVAAANAGDLQSWEEKTIAVLEASLTGSLESGIAEYQIHGRAVKYIPLEERVAMLARLKASLQQKKTGRFTTPVYTRFTPPC